MTDRIEAALEAVVARAEAGAPPQLGKALRHALFPGGARVRPRLCVAVAEACGDDAPAMTEAAAAGLEMLHCASLVHDDLPCFDDASTRRGRASVHRVFGEPLAVLVGDGMIVLAFEALALAAGAPAASGLVGVGDPAAVAARVGPLVALLARAAGTPRGLVAGQAWESEPVAPLTSYHQAKTGALFRAATMAGALAAGRDPAPWESMGVFLGQAYQVADDLLDTVECAGAGKPSMQDAALGRPNAVAEWGVDGALARLKGLVSQAVEAVPACRGADRLRGLVLAVAQRLVPEQYRALAA
jgi:geranylgeranyl diphosphate synthase type II